MAPSPVRSSSSTSSPPTSGSKAPFPVPLVAIVDDDRQYLRAVDAVVRRLGYRCETFESVEAFVHAKALHRAHCLLLDIGMPTIDGLKAYHGLRQTNFRAPIVFCTGHAKEELSAEATADTATFYLQKPVRSETLASVLRAALPMGRG